MAADAAVPALCPHCGIDLRRDEPMIAGDLVVEPRGVSTLDGRPLHLTPSERSVLLALVKAEGRAVSAAALAERMGSEGEYRVTDIYVCRLRRKLAEIRPGHRFIETMTAVGYRWAGG